MVDLDAFRALSAALDYPMFVVTAVAADDGERAGCLVGFTTQCSIDPVRFVVCLSRKNHTYRVARRGELLGVHLLGAGQAALAEFFGTETGDDVDKFDGRHCRWTAGAQGVPLLDDCPNRFVGRVLTSVDAGDHVGFVVDVVEAWAEDPGPVLTFEQVRHLEPGHPA